MQARDIRTLSEGSRRGRVRRGICVIRARALSGGSEDNIEKAARGREREREREGKADSGK